MSPEEKAQFNQLIQTVSDLKRFIEQNFNPDGSTKLPPIVIEVEDATTTASGSIRVITNKGPKNILVA